MLCLNNYQQATSKITKKNSITESFIDKVLSAHDCSNIGYVLLVDLIYPDIIKQKKQKFPVLSR